MAWIEQRSDSIDRLCLSGVWLQITSGAVIGHFGRRAQYWSERLICEGKAHILASDTHDPHHRPPLMREAFDRVAGWVGDAEAMNMVHHRPRLVLENGSPNSILVDAPSQMRDHTAARSLWGSVKSFILKNETYE
jgi:protein-tyrosine phosphatase